MVIIKRDMLMYKKDRYFLKLYWNGVINMEFGKIRISLVIKLEMVKFKDRFLIWNKSLVYFLSIIIDMKFLISII